MSDFLETLEAVNTDPLLMTRDKFLADIELQKKAVAAQLHDEPFKPNKRAFHVWHHLRRNAWWCCLKAGHTALIINGGQLFRAGKELADVLTFYDSIAESVEKGELDDVLRETMKRRERA